MTTQKSFKRRVRARMEKTGESYTAARRMLIAAGDRPEPVTQAFTAPVSEARLVAETGRTYEQWFAVIDAAGIGGAGHTAIAKHLRDAVGVHGWWAQSITLAFERARGLRAPGQRPDGFAITVTRTVPVAVEELFAAFTDETRRERWAPGAELRVRTTLPPRSARFDWEDGSTRVNVGFEAVGESRSRVALEHARLPDADTAEAMKDFWRERLDALVAG